MLGCGCDLDQLTALNCGMHVLDPFLVHIVPIVEDDKLSRASRKCALRRDLDLRSDF